MKKLFLFLVFMLCFASSVPAGTTWLEGVAASGYENKKPAGVATAFPSGIERVYALAKMTHNGIGATWAKVYHNGNFLWDTTKAPYDTKGATWTYWETPWVDKPEDGEYRLDFQFHAAGSSEVTPLGTITFTVGK